MKTTPRIVLVGGCFDLIHYGHIKFLGEAKSHGDYLIVALESDENVRRMKGQARPIHSQKQRKEMLEAISFVDEVISLPPMHTDQEYFDLVTKLRPAVLAITDGDPLTDKKTEQANMVGAQLVMIPKIHTPSTSQLAKLLGLE
ncbi:adenylyltransferase/cytidyltransferase family protein [Candidatus Gottesmanbacteria bacterium]|nr:adenylyltransferase/cytidyltransferase family protein [Candidatus Gottesmanbacteria bacterium]